MLVELGLVEQRYRAVLEVLDGAASVTDVARRYGVGRQTVHTWLRRYAAEGLPALADRSSRPSNCPHQMPPAVEARVVEMRRQHRGWGAAHDPEQACPRRRLASPLSVRHLPGARPPPAHRPQATAQAAQRLQALGALAGDGALADGHYARGAATGWLAPLDRDGHRRPVGRQNLMRPTDTHDANLLAAACVPPESRATMTDADASRCSAGRTHQAPAGDVVR